MVQVSQEKLITGAIARKVVSFPTDTVPALAVKPERADLIYQLKQRPSHKPLILMGASIADLLPYVDYTSSQLLVWRQLIDRHLPGALTLVLPASPKVPEAVNPTNSHTVGIRVPNHPTAIEILQQTGVLATSSANISGEDTITTMEEIDRAFPTVLVLKTQTSLTTGSGLPSTVVFWQDDKWQVLRQGSVNI